MGSPCYRSGSASGTGSRDGRVLGFQGTRVTCGVSPRNLGGTTSALGQTGRLWKGTSMKTRREFIQTVPAIGAAFAVTGRLLEEPAMAQTTAPPTGHFHPKGKPPSEHTLRVLREAKRTLPFGDTRDFDENRKNLIAEMKELKI